VVASEVIFVYLKRTTGKSYLTLKKEKELVKEIEKAPVYRLLGEFKFLDVNEFVFNKATNELLSSTVFYPTMPSSLQQSSSIVARASSLSIVISWMSVKKRESKSSLLPKN
jgi:hypothetical protein